MKKETIKNKVFEIIKSRLFHKDTPLTMESKLEDDLWMDSLDEVEILMELEKEFGILIPDDDPGRWENETIQRLGRDRQGHERPCHLANLHGAFRERPSV